MVIFNSYSMSNYRRVYVLCTPSYRWTVCMENSWMTSPLKICGEARWGTMFKTLRLFGVSLTFNGARALSHEKIAFVGAHRGLTPPVDFRSKTRCPRCFAMALCSKLPKRHWGPKVAWQGLQGLQGAKNHNLRSKITKIIGSGSVWHILIKCD